MPHPIKLRGAILQPRDDGSVKFIRDGAIAGDVNGCIEFVGEFAKFPGRDPRELQTARGVICPPFLDNHIHIPQHPIRGHFMDGVGANPPGGRLIAGLNRNVFPAEARCADAEFTRQCVAEFLRDTLAHGVAGGCAYMTVHPAAARTALESLPATWSAGLVMMNQNCPEYLRNDVANFDRDAEALARDFGRRYVVTDRFALACDRNLRRRGVAIAKRFDLRMQTHLNEQLGEKHFVEHKLYPGESYTGVYRADGLLDRGPSDRAVDRGGTILAHCIHMTDSELDLVAEMRAVVAHCPVSNTLLGSGIMPLDAIVQRGIDYAICTDVGASPTTSLLNEMAQFLKVHAGRSTRATPSEALFRTTLGAARMMKLDDRLGRLEAGAPISFIEVRCDHAVLDSCHTSDEVIAHALLDLPRDYTARLGGGAMRQSLDVLATGRADAGEHIDRLSADVNATVAALDGKIARVVLDGEAP